MHVVCHGAPYVLFVTVHRIYMVLVIPERRQYLIYMMQFMWIILRINLLFNIMKLVILFQKDAFHTALSSLPFKGKTKCLCTILASIKSGEV